MKPKLLLHPDKWSNAVAPFLEPLFDEHFERVFIDSTTTYNPKESIVYSHCIDWEWIIPWYDKGYTVVIDNLWERDDSLDINDVPSGVNIIQSDSWFFRANESLWYKSLGYDRYLRQPNITKTFLMFLNNAKLFRDQIFEQIDLSNSIHSYRARGIKLNYQDSTSDDWQRYFNPDWYDITNFSMVVESTIIQENLWHTEKTWKPIAFHHPFLLWGPPGYVSNLRKQGFETFDHVIDESYDIKLDDVKRLRLIIEQVDRLKNIKLTDDETIKRTTHNHNLFFDTAWSKQQFNENLFLPLLELL